MIPKGGKNLKRLPNIIDEDDVELRRLFFFCFFVLGSVSQHFFGQPVFGPVKSHNIRKRLGPAGRHDRFFFFSGKNNNRQAKANFLQSYKECRVIDLVRGGTPGL
jgi:hypothetical protein